MIYILSASTVRTLCPEINATISDEMIYKAMILSQDTTIHTTLGGHWYHHFMDEASAHTYSTADQYVLDNYISYILSYDILKQLVIQLSFQLNEAGLRIKVSDHSTLAESKDISFYRTYVENFIDSKREDMNRYVRHHQSDYPYYFNSHDGRNHRNIYDFTIKRI